MSRTTSIKDCIPEIIEGRLLICSADGHADFGTYYKGYFPCCRFTALGSIGSVWYAAGTDPDQKTHLFTSYSGEVWTEISAEASFGDAAGQLYGDVLAIYEGELADEILLICSGGISVTVPDCIHCIEAVHFTDEQIIAAERRSDRIIITSASGKKLSKRIEELANHRVTWQWFSKHHASLIDLRPEEESEKLPFPFGYSAPLDQFEEQLANFHRDAFLALISTDAVSADEAARNARRKGWKNCRSLGSIQEALSLS